MHRQKETKEGTSLVSRGTGEPIPRSLPSLASSAGTSLRRETSIKLVKRLPPADHGHVRQGQGAGGEGRGRDAGQSVSQSLFAPRPTGALGKGALGTRKGHTTQPATQAAAAKAEGAAAAVGVTRESVAAAAESAATKVAGEENVAAAKSAAADASKQVTDSAKKAAAAVGVDLEEPDVKRGWSIHKNIDTPKGNDAETIHNWKDEYSLEDLMTMVETKGYSAICVQAKSPHAILKKVSYQLTPDNCEKSEGYKNDLYIYCSCIDSGMVLVKRGDKGMLRFDRAPMMKVNGGEVRFSCKLSHPGIGIGRAGDEEKTHGEWRYIESMCVGAKESCKVKLVQKEKEGEGLNGHYFSFTTGKSPKKVVESFEARVNAPGILGSPLGGGKGDKLTVYRDGKAGEQFKIQGEELHGATVGKLGAVPPKGYGRDIVWDNGTTWRKAPPPGGPFIKLSGADLVLDVAFGKFAEGTPLNWVGGDSDEKTYLAGGSRDWQVNEDGSISPLKHPDLCLGVKHGFGTACCVIS